MTAAEGLVSNKGNTSGEVKADDEVKIDKNAQMMSPVEESDEAVTAKVLPSPSPPSRQEMLEHNITHMPFRNWCPHCLAGKAKSTKHMQGAGLGVSETPIISMDYMFMGDKNTDVNEEDAEEDARISEDKFEEEDKDDQKAKILVMRDARSRLCGATPVPKKGLDAEGWSLKESLRFLELLGYTKTLYWKVIRRRLWRLYLLK